MAFVKFLYIKQFKNKFSLATMRGGGGGGGGSTAPLIQEALLVSNYYYVIFLAILLKEIAILGQISNNVYRTALHLLVCQLVTLLLVFMFT